MLERFSVINIALIVALIVTWIGGFIIFMQINNDLGDLKDTVTNLQTGVGVIVTDLGGVSDWTEQAATIINDNRGLIEAIVSEQDKQYEAIQEILDFLGLEQ